MFKTHATTTNDLMSLFCLDFSVISAILKDWLAVWDLSSLDCAANKESRDGMINLLRELQFIPKRSRFNFRSELISVERLMSWCEKRNISCEHFIFSDVLFKNCSMATKFRAKSVEFHNSIADAKFVDQFCSLLTGVESLSLNGCKFSFLQSVLRASNSLRNASIIDGECGKLDLLRMLEQHCPMLTAVSFGTSAQKMHEAEKPNSPENELHSFEKLKSTLTSIECNAWDLVRSESFAKFVNSLRHLQELVVHFHYNTPKIYAKDILSGILTQNPDLRSLTMDGPVPDINEFVASFAQNGWGRQLTVLKGAVSYRYEMLRELLQHAPQLSHFDGIRRDAGEIVLRGSFKMTEEQLVEILQMLFPCRNSLAKVSIIRASAPLSSSFMAYLAESHNESLQSLEIDGQQAVADADLLSLLAVAKRLRFLDLRHCYGVTIDVMERFLQLDCSVPISLHVAGGSSELTIRNGRCGRKLKVDGFDYIRNNSGNSAKKLSSEEYAVHLLKTDKLDVLSFGLHFSSNAITTAALKIKNSLVSFSVAQKPPCKAVPTILANNPGIRRFRVIGEEGEVNACVKLFPSLRNVEVIEFERYIPSKQVITAVFEQCPVKKVCITAHWSNMPKPQVTNQLKGVYGRRLQLNGKNEQVWCLDDF